MAGGVAQEQGAAAFVGALGGELADLGAALGEAGVDRRGGDGTGGNVEQIEARALAQKPDGQGGGVPGRARGVEMRGDLGAVVILGGGTDDGRDGEGDVGHALEQLLDLAAFPGELLGVGEVLVLAAAAAGEERADRFDAVGRGDEDGEQVGLGEVLMVAKDAGAHAFAGEGEGHHDDPARGGIGRMGHATDADAEVGEGAYLQLELGVVGEGIGVEGFLAAHQTHETHETPGEEDFLFVSFRVFRGPWPRSNSSPVSKIRE